MSDTQPTRGRRGSGATGATVDAFLEQLEHPHLAAIRLLRAAILSVDLRIQESVKWNAPSFALEEHFATFKLRPVETVQLVLHTGAKVRASPARITIDDPAGLLVWVTPDRAVVTFAGCRSRERCASLLDRLHSVQTKHAHCPSQVAPGGQVPAPRVEDHTVRVHPSLRCGAPSLVAHLHSLSLLYGQAEPYQNKGVGIAHISRDREADDIAHGLDALAQCIGKHALDLGERPGHRRTIHVHPLPLRCKQAEGDRERLVVGEHQRRELEPRPQLVAAIWAAGCLDRNAEILEHRDIAPYRTAVYFELSCDRRSRSWVIYHVMEHDLHHGGEVSLLLGMNGLRALEL